MGLLHYPTMVNHQALVNLLFAALASRGAAIFEEQYNRTKATMFGEKWNTYRFIVNACCSFVDLYADHDR
jgi:hypothetical protein